MLNEDSKKNRLKGQLSIKGKTTISYFLFLLAAPSEWLNATHKMNEEKKVHKQQTESNYIYFAWVTRRRLTELPE